MGVVRTYRYGWLMSVVRRYRFPHMHDIIITYPHSTCITSFLQQHPYFIVHFFVLVGERSEPLLSEFSLYLYIIGERSEPPLSVELSEFSLY